MKFSKQHKTNFDSKETMTTLEKGFKVAESTIRNSSSTVNQEQKNIIKQNQTELSQPLTKIIDHIIGQLDTITNTIVSFEGRLRAIEKAVYSQQKD